MNGMKERPQPAEFLNQRRVFFVGSKTDNTVLIAIHPQYDEQTRMLRWWDTVKERAKQVKTMGVGETPVLQVTDAQDNAYVFVPLSLPLYNNVVKHQLPGKREFATEEEMIKAFEATMV